MDWQKCCRPTSTDRQWSKTEHMFEMDEEGEAGEEVLVKPIGGVLPMLLQLLPLRPWSGQSAATIAADAFDRVEHIGRVWRWSSRSGVESVHRCWLCVAVDSIDWETIDRWKGVWEMISDNIAFDPPAWLGTGKRNLRRKKGNKFED